MASGVLNCPHGIQPRRNQQEIRVRELVASQTIHRPIVRIPNRHNLRSAISVAATSQSHRLKFTTDRSTLCTKPAMETGSAMNRRNGANRIRRSRWTLRAFLTFRPFPRKTAAPAGYRDIWRTTRGLHFVRAARRRSTTTAHRQCRVNIAPCSLSSRLAA